MTGLDRRNDREGRLPSQPSPARCILVVDDSAAIRGVVARALSEARYAVLEAEDGALALEILEHGGVGIDLVLTDIKMPRLDGLALGRCIAARHWQVPVLYMTGGTGDGIDADGAGNAVAPLLRKPFSIGLLIDMVDRLLPARPPETTALEGCPAPA